MKKIATVLLPCLLAGCASTYAPPAEQASAHLSFHLTNDSTGTTNRFFRMVAYDNLACAPSRHGETLAVKAFAGDSERLGPVKVEAGKSLTFSVLYGESRFAQNRSCTFTASFLPQPGQSYVVRFAAIDQSMACGLRIFDEREANVPFETPALSCAETMAGRTKNGGAGILNWVFSVR